MPPNELVVVNRGIPGATAYERAVALEGFSGTEQEWLESLKADPTELNAAVQAVAEDRAVINQDRQAVESARDETLPAAAETLNQAEAAIAARQLADQRADQALASSGAAAQSEAQAEAARQAAEAFATSAGTAARFYDTIALGRAAVADGETFGVRAGGGDGLAQPTIYRRDSSTTQTAVVALVNDSAITKATTLIGATVAPVQERTARLGDIPPILIGGRLMQPQELSFDLMEDRGYWTDTGLPWMPGDPLAGVLQAVAIAETLPGIVAPLDERTRAILDVPELHFGPRSMQPQELSFDLSVDRGHWIDTGLAFLPGDPLGDQIAATEVGGIAVTEWSFDLVPARGYQISTGEAFPATGGPAASVNPAMQVQVVSASLIYIYIRQFADTYVRWALEHSVVPARNCNVWRIGAAHHVTRFGSSFTSVQAITFNGETDVAILLRQSPGGASKADHIGGAIHGNEEMQHATILVDGVAINPGFPAGTWDAGSVELIQCSDMFEVGNTNETRWEPKGALIMRHGKRISISADGWFRQRSFIEHIVGGFEVANSYYGMLCVNWGTRGIDAVHTGARAPFWAPEDVSLPNFQQIYDTSDNLKAWGDLYAAEVRMIEGWDRPGRNVKIDNRPDRRKIYPDFHDGDITSTDTPWSVGVDYRITIKEPT